MFPGAPTASPRSSAYSPSVRKDHKARASTPRSSLTALFSPRSSSPSQHSDPKGVFEGLEGASLHAALNHPQQLRAMLGHGHAHLLANKRDSDGDRYPLHWAAARGRVRCVEMLLEVGAVTQVTDAQGRTPAELAHEQGQVRIKKTLQEWHDEWEQGAADSSASSPTPSPTSWRAPVRGGGGKILPAPDVPVPNPCATCSRLGAAGAADIH